MLMVVISFYVHNVVAIYIGFDHLSRKNLNKHVVSHVSANWYNLGSKLLDEATLETIKGEYSDEIDCVRVMFDCWLKTPYATWSVLLKAIDDVGNPSLASKLKNSLIPEGM